MGMYTGLRFKGYVKPEFRENFENIATMGLWEEHEDPTIKRFGDIGRSTFIPCGRLSYMPNSWEDEHEIGTDGFERSYNKETGYWTFQCSLKNYEGEIQEWFKIVPYFIERIVHLEYLYEQNEYSQEYNIVDGKIEMVNARFKHYNLYY